MDGASSAELLARWRDGDQRAADALFERYVAQLVALTRSRLPQKLARRFDAEDVVQSAYRSFFDKARDDRYVLRRSGDLWRLLAAITKHKLYHRIEYHTAAMRDVAAERHFTQESGVFGLPVLALAHDPSPADAAALDDELEEVLRGLEPRYHRMVVLRLEGYTEAEIAAATERSERTVRRVLDRLKQRLRERFSEYSNLK